MSVCVCEKPINYNTVRLCHNNATSLRSSDVQNKCSKLLKVEHRPTTNKKTTALSRIATSKRRYLSATCNLCTTVGIEETITALRRGVL